MVAAPPRLLPSLVLAASCAGSGRTSDTGSAAYFCYQMADADTWYLQDGGGSGQSGVLQGQVVTSVTDDIHNPNMVANWDYVVENIDVGGTQTRGRTNDAGEFGQTLGDGNWVIEISGQRNGFTCSNQIEFQVVAGRTTVMCFDASCR